MRLNPETLKVLLDQELISKLGLLVRTQTRAMKYEFVFELLVLAGTLTLAKNRKLRPQTRKLRPT